MKTENYYKIAENGAIKMVTNTEVEVDVAESLIQSLSANATRKITRAFPMRAITGEKDNVDFAHIVSGNGGNTVSMRLRSIPLSTVYLMDGDVMYPAFDAEGPIMPITWKAPDSMLLVLAACLDPSNEIVNQFLVAFDHGLRAYRMPLSNLYEDAKLCPGQDTDQMRYSSSLESATQAWSQFQRSIWQKDLYSGASDDLKLATRKLFRFKAKNEGFEQQGILGSWESNCKKLGVEFITKNIFP